MASKDADEANTMKILVATDIHLGYGEKDPVRGDDSQNAFEEILQLAACNKVDFVLLGGDLFHENKPSRRSLHFAMKVLRRYCMGDKPCSIEFLSDQSVDFGHNAFPSVNYEDPNLNVSIPVFSIHGNHDDPAGQGSLCSLDLLSAAGLVNYFGKYTSLEQIDVSPMLMQKGSTKLALYGIGSIRDERMHRMFLQQKVRMLRPKETRDDWFNVLVLHQNRAKHGQTNYIPENFLDNFLNLVIWGHEHECRIEPELNPVQEFYVSQPGSSIATSLSEGETREKHVGLLLIRGKEFRMEKLKLETVRPFYLEEIVLADTRISPTDRAVDKKVQAYVSEKVESLIQRASHERRSNLTPDKPLIRLKIDYSGGFEAFNVHRFSQQFVNKVANPGDMIMFHRKRQQRSEAGAAHVDLQCKVDGLDTHSVSDLVTEYFSKQDKEQQLRLLTERGLGQAVQYFVDKDEKCAISELVGKQLTKIRDNLKRNKTREEDIDMVLCRIKELRKKADEDREIEEAMAEAKKKRQDMGADDEPPQHDDQDSDEGESSKQTPPTRGKGRGRGSRGGRGRGRGQTDTDLVLDDTDTSKPAKGRGRGRGRGQKQAVVKETPQPKKATLDSFLSSSSRGSTSRDCMQKRKISDDDMFDDDLMMDVVAESPPARQGAKTVGKKRGGVQFDDSDSEGYVPPSKAKKQWW